MGNDHAKRFSGDMPFGYDKKSPANNISFSFLFDPVIMTNLFDVFKNSYSHERFTELENAIILNAKKTNLTNNETFVIYKQKQERLNSMAVAGHESLNEILVIISKMYLNEPTVLREYKVYTYSLQRSKELAISLWIITRRFLESSEIIKNSANFYRRIDDFFMQLKGSNSGISLALQLAAVCANVNNALINDKALNTIKDKFKEVSSLSFHGWTKEIFALERSIEYIKKSLINQLNSQSFDSISKSNLENAIKTIGYIGLARGSIEDLLVMIQLMMRLGVSMEIKDIFNKVLELPKVIVSKTQLNLDEANYIVPFTQLYGKKIKTKEKKVFALTSATDGTYIYFWSSDSNSDKDLMFIGVGKGKEKGRIYSKNRIFEDEEKPQLIVLKGKLYLYSNCKLLKVNKEDFSLKESNKNNRIVVKANSLLTATENTLVVYTEMDTRAMANSSNKDKVEAVVCLYEFNEKIDFRKVNISHCIDDLKEITLYRSLLILSGSKKYTIIDLEGNIEIGSYESSFLVCATLCCNQKTNELFLIYYLSDSKYFILSKYDLTIIHNLEPSFIDKKVEKLQRQINKANYLDYSKSKIKSLLRIEAIPEEDKRESSNSPNNINDLLSLLAYRAERFGTTIDAIDSEKTTELLEVYKSPVALHLTSNCLNTQLELIEEIHKELTTAKGEDEISKIFEKLHYLMVILGNHLKALKKCNIPWDDCAGTKGTHKYTELSRKLFIQISNKTIFNKYSLSNHELIKALCESAENCLWYNQNFILISVENHLKLFHELFKELINKKQPGSNFDALMNWINIPHNIDLVVNSIISQTAEAIEFLDLYFNVEANYFCESMRKLGTDSHEVVNYKRLIDNFKEVFENLSIRLGIKLMQRNNNLQDLIASTLPAILHKYIKLITMEVKSTYESYKDFLISNLSELFESNTLNLKYAKYWKPVNKLIKDDMSLFGFLLSLTTMAVGTALSLDQAMNLSYYLAKSANELKIVVDILSTDNLKKYKDIKAGLEKTFTSGEEIREEEKKIERIFEFPGATEVVVYTKENPSIPSTSGRIIISSISENIDSFEVTANTKKFRKVFYDKKIKVTSNVKLSVKSSKRSSIKYCIRLKPKVFSLLTWIV